MQHVQFKQNGNGPTKHKQEQNMPQQAVAQEMVDS